MRKSALLGQIDQLQQLLSTQAAEQRLLIAQLNQRIDDQRRRAQEVELRLQQRLASLEEALAAELCLLVEARERQQAAVAQLHDALQTHRHELQAIENVLDAA